MRPQTLFKALFSLSFHFIFATSLWGCYYYYHLLFTEKKGIRGSLSFPSPSISKGQSWDLTQTVGLWSQPTKPLLQLFLLLPCLPKRPSHNYCTKKKKKSAPEKLQSSKKELRYWDNWHTALYKLKIYSIMIWPTYTVKRPLQ